MSPFKSGEIHLDFAFYNSKSIDYRNFFFQYGYIDSPFIDFDINFQIGFISGISFIKLMLLTFTTLKFATHSKKSKTYEIRSFIFYQDNLLLISWLKYKYRTRATISRCFYSKKDFLALTLPHKKQIKYYFSLKT